MVLTTGRARIKRAAELLVLSAELVVRMDSSQIRGISKKVV